jgi:hypothetical protein
MPSVALPKITLENRFVFNDLKNRRVAWQSAQALDRTAGVKPADKTTRPL